MSLASKFIKKPLVKPLVSPKTLSPNLSTQPNHPSGGVIRKMVSVFKPKDSTQLVNPSIDSTDADSAPEQAKKKGLIGRAIGLMKRKPLEEAAPQQQYVDLSELMVQLALHAGVSELLAESARQNMAFDAQDFSWVAEIVGEKKDKVMLRTGFALNLKAFDKLKSLVIFSFASAIAKDHGAFAWLNDENGNFEVGWVLGRLDRLSAKNCLAIFDNAVELAPCWKKAVLQI
jgi:hypothetical protein